MHKDTYFNTIGPPPKKVANNVSSTIKALADSPRPVNYKKLKGVDDAYRIQVGDYRILYTVDDSIVTAEVIKIGNCKNMYE